LIYYDTNSSSFFKANENYCLPIEQLFSSLNISCEGYCNSWGYEIRTSYIKSNITFDFTFYKETIRKGGIMPIDCPIIEGLDLIVKPFNRTHKIYFQESKFKRLFMSKYRKEIVPSPYYFSSNVVLPNEVIKWVSLFETYEMYLLKLNNGKLVVEINRREEDPLILIEELEKMIKFYI